MHVVATAGHVDHGKSTLVRALTGMEPDRWASERRRGMTIDLGFAWTTLPSGATVAFVDVPGHERFVPNMLAGVGPVPAAMIVVAADEGWMPQSAEHLAALAALDVRHGLLVVTRSDLADPSDAIAEAKAEIAGTVLGDIPAVAVSGATGEGLDDLRVALDALLGELPPPDRTAPVRLWIDRAFTVKGAGTVVTGTLGAGTIRTGDELQLGDQAVRVRGLQSMGRSEKEVAAIARVAVNLRGVDRDTLGRGDALLSRGRFRATDLVDVRVHGEPAADLPASLTLHVGSAAVPVRVRPLGADTARLRLSRALPLRIGDRALLRDPGRHHVAGGVTVLDVVPPGLSRRGAAAARAAQLSAMDGVPDLAAEVARRGLVRAAELAAMGVPLSAPVTAPGWYAAPDRWSDLSALAKQQVSTYQTENPLEPGMPLDVLRHRLGVPDRVLVEALIEPPLALRNGRVTTGGKSDVSELAAALDKAFAGLPPFTAPEANDLAAHGLHTRQLAAAVRLGMVVQLAPQVILRPEALDHAAAVLSELTAPFTLSEARRALDTTRRVAVPLLELLDRRGITQRHPDDRRTVT